MDLTPSSILGALRNLAAIPTKLSQLTNDTNYQTAQTINSTVVPRYAKQHVTTNTSGNSFDTLNVTWPVGRFSSAPIMPDPTVVTSSTTQVYKAVVTSCTATGCTIKLTQQPMVVNNLLGLTSLSLQTPVTSSLTVNVFAIQQTD